ncbi:MAG TPA: enolase C-terminal domain-like protein [Mycobacteriales bacterium]|jgi:L-alanine-DL-glutamate epimerase-like enolase superfamily enzyme|nr:enolase C-terminal domain-like protein [Mycobacteriales bacterium]
MPKLVKIEAVPIRVSLTKPVTTSNKTTETARAFLLKLTDSDGLAGWGEGSFNQTFTDESEASLAADLVAVLEPALLGREPAELIAGLATVHRTLRTRIALRCATSIAVHDLVARHYGIPLYVMLGGLARRSVPTVAFIGNFDRDAAEADAVEAVGRGFSAIKLKVGRPDVAEDLDAVRGVRSRMPAAMRLYVDANQAWTPAQAYAFVGQAVSLGVTLVEQPVAAWDARTLATLGHTAGVDVAADESVFDASQLLGRALAGCTPAAVVVKLLKAGGIDGVVDVLRVAGTLGVRPFVAGMPGDTSVLSAAMLNIALSTPSLPLGTAITPHHSRVDVVVRPLSVVDGQLTVDGLTGSGIGVEVDEERVAAVAC